MDGSVSVRRASVLDRLHILVYRSTDAKALSSPNEHAIKELQKTGSNPPIEVTIVAVKRFLVLRRHKQLVCVVEIGIKVETPTIRTRTPERI